MVDYNFITDRVATGGGISNDDDVKELLSHNIDTIIDCRAEFDDASLFANHSNIRYLNIGVPDDGQPKPVEWFQKGIEFALDALSRPNHKVYAHCAAGISRGPSMCIAILMAQGLNLNDAESQIRKYRPQVGLTYKLDAWKAVQELGYADKIEGSAFGEVTR